jgi:oligoendopeptidase F
MRQEMTQLGAAFGAQTAFVEPELLRAGKPTLERFVATEPRLKIYTFYLEDVARRAAHTLNADEERRCRSAGERAGQRVHDPVERRLSVPHGEVERWPIGEDRPGRVQ